LELEPKREIAGRKIQNPAQIVLFIVGAAFGIVMPALVFYVFNHADAFALKDWAIPTATDTAFALGIIMILGKIVPASLKFFRDAIIHRRRLRDFDNGDILRRISLGDVVYGC